MIYDLILDGLWFLFIFLRKEKYGDHHIGRRMETQITQRVDALLERSKKLQNMFLIFLIKNKLSGPLENWTRTSTTPGLTIISGMPHWIHNLQQYCVDQAQSQDLGRRQKFKDFAQKITANNGTDRGQISERNIDCSLAIQLLQYEHYLFEHTTVNLKHTYKEHLNTSRINRNSLSHYSPATPISTKVADINNILDGLEQFINFIINDLNERNESTVYLHELKEELEACRTELSDIAGEQDEHINYLSHITAYVSRVENSFLEMLSKFVHLDINEEITTQYSSPYVDEILIDEKTVPRRGKIEEILPTIDEKKMLLTGGAGVGKSTTLAFLAYMDAKSFLDNTDHDRETLDVPVLLRLNTLTQEDVSIIDKIADNFKISVQQVKLLLNKNQIKIYLDGLNEIPNASGSTLKQKRISEIKDLIDNYPQIILVCSTRESDAEFLRGIPCFRVLQMDDQLVKEFIEKNAKDITAKKILLNEFEKTKSLIRSVHTPLYVTRLIMVVTNTGKMPCNEADILGKYLNELFKRERNEKAVDVDPKKVSELLSEFAYVIREKYQANVPVKYSTLIGIFDKKGIYPKEKLYDILNLCIDMEIISVEDEDMGLYAFSHETYQEYYRAQVDDLTL